MREPSLSQRPGTDWDDPEKADELPAESVHPFAGLFPDEHAAAGDHGEPGVPSAGIHNLGPVQPRSRREAKEAAALEHAKRSRPARPRRRWLKPLVIVAVSILVLGGMGATAYTIFQPDIQKVVRDMQPIDYTGHGYGHVDITIKEGDGGLDVANTLTKAGVTKTSEAFYNVIIAQQPNPVFQPGVYRLAKHMSAKSALAALQNPSSLVSEKAVIPEGTTEANVLPIVAKATKIPLAQLQAAAADVSAYGLPPQAASLEGFLFPATYLFPPHATAQQVLTTMVQRSFQSLNAAGVSPANRWNTIVLASIVQKEAGVASDFPKVARVFLNRLAIGMPLQSDATVAYGAGTTGSVTTTDAERADASNPYNTYVHAGLPVGPISNPGDTAIDAVVNPAAGSWLYFVTVNLKTGQTVFSDTYAEQEQAVAQWQQWMKDNPGYG
jgi:UPF0755 protein